MTHPLYIVAPILPTEAINWSHERKVRYIQDQAYVPRDPKIPVMVTSLPHFNDYFNCLVTKNTTPRSENHVNILKELKKKALEFKK